jgi:hypothetical protein
MVTSMARIGDSDNDVQHFPDEENRPLFPHLWKVRQVVIMVPATPVIILYNDATLVAPPVPPVPAEVDAAMPE